MPTQKIEVSSRTIIFTIFFLILLKVLWISRDLILSLFIAFILMSALKPFVSGLTRAKIPRALAVFLIYIIFLTVFFSAVFLIVPPLFKEATLLLKNLPLIFQTISVDTTLFGNLDSFFQFLPNATNQFFNLIKNLFSNALFFISTIFFGFYFLLEENLIKRFLMRFFEEGQAQQVAAVFDKVEKRMNAWFWGELTLMTVVGAMTFIGLNLIGMNYVLPLSVLAGLLEVVPNIGPTVSAVPAVIIGFSHSYFLGFTNLALYFIIQQLENNLIVPLVMKKVVGLNPIITLIALIVGGKLAGVMGVLLAVPTTLFLETALIETLTAKKTNK